MGEISVLAGHVLKEIEHIDSSMDHHQGNNLLMARNDVQAIISWLTEFKHSPHTFRSYEKESFRFLYWLYVAKKKDFAAVQKQDVHEYRFFLMDPQPHDFWCASPSERKLSKQQKHWKPFSGPLKIRSIQTAMTILSGMFSYFVDARYLNANPFHLIKQKLVEQFDVEARKIDLQERLLTRQEFELLIDAVEELRQSQRKSDVWCDRSHFILLFLAFTGLRVGEFVSHKWTNCVCRDGLWWFNVLGKGRKLAKIPLIQECIEVMNLYRGSLGWLPLHSEFPLESYPLVCSFNKKHEAKVEESLTERSIQLILKEIADQAVLMTNHVHLKEKFSKFSPHWLRHFSASAQAQADIPFEHIKAHLRHTKRETTELYLHWQDEERHTWAQKFSLLNGKQS